LVNGNTKTGIANVDFNYPLGDIVQEVAAFYRLYNRKLEALEEDNARVVDDRMCSS